MRLKNLKIEKELIEVSSKILNSKISLIKGTEWIDSLIDTTNREYDFLLPIKGIVSEADDIVREKNGLSPTGLYLIDLIDYEKDLKTYFDEVKPLILEVCKKVIKRYQDGVLK